MPKVLVANRGESTCHIPTCETFLTSLIRSPVAIRILRAATELGWSTITIFTENDSSHAGYADESVELGSATDFMDVDLVVKIALKYAVPPSPLHSWILIPLLLEGTIAATYTRAMASSARTPSCRLLWRNRQNTCLLL